MLAQGNQHTKAIRHSAATRPFTPPTPGFRASLVCWETTSTTVTAHPGQRSRPSVTTASLIAQLLKNLPAMRETWVQSLGWEDPTFVK